MVSLMALIALRAHIEFPVGLSNVLWPLFPCQLASEISLFGLVKSPNKYSEVGGTVVLLHRAE